MRPLATVVEIDNRITGQRGQTIVPIPASTLVDRLKLVFLAIHPDTGEPMLIDRDPFGRAPFDVCVSLTPSGRIRVTVYPTWDEEATAPGPDAFGPLADDRAAWLPEPFGQEEPYPEMLDASIEEIKNLVRNVRALMQRHRIGVKSLAARADVSELALAMMLENVADPLVTVVCRLAEYFGTTVDALLSPPQQDDLHRRAGE